MRTMQTPFDVSSSFLLHSQLLLQPTYQIRSHLQIQNYPYLTDPFIPETPDPHNEIGSTYDEVGNILYWYNIQHKDGNMKLVVVETMHHSCMKQMLYMEVRDPRVPSSYNKAILIPMWKTAICVELDKLKKHDCLLLMHFDGQHLVPMK